MYNEKRYILAKLLAIAIIILLIILLVRAETTFYDNENEFFIVSNTGEIIDTNKINSITVYPKNTTNITEINDTNNLSIGKKEKSEYMNIIIMFIALSIAIFIYAYSKNKKSQS